MLADCRIGAAGSQVARTSMPSAHGQVAATTFLLAARAAIHSGSAVGSVLSIGSPTVKLYLPMGAAKPLMPSPMRLATRWKLVATTSLCAACEPVAMAMWLGAVSEGVIVAQRRRSR